MPKVGNTEFPYTKEGIAKAKAWSEMTGKPMQMEKKYQSKETPQYGLGGWLKKRLTPSKKAKKWWNKNIKPAGKQNLWEGIGTVAHAVDPTGISGLATCLGQGKNYWDCVKYRGERDLSGAIKKKGSFPSPGQIMQNPEWAAGVPGDIPTHTGTDVTQWNADFSDLAGAYNLSQEQIQDLMTEYGDNTGDLSTQQIMDMIAADAAASQPQPSKKDRGMPMKFWGFEKFGGKKTQDWQKSIQDLLKGGRGVKKMELGGPLSTPMMNPSRRMYNMKKKPVMQTSTAGMPMRGGSQFKKGGAVKIPKGWHI